MTNKHSEANRHIVTTFHYKYATKITGSFLELLPGIIFSGGTTKSMPILPNKCSKENYTQLANLCNI